MLVKLAALGALGYAGYRYLQKNQATQGGNAGQVALAGGPLSSQARIQSDPDTPPASATAAGDILSTMP
ncbi:hypothetical protein [Novosphingobium sp. 9U]|uniref:hypothetical protein n=1 Tax=Novosphingobium sp. 9U TaxID=2653158 RepID=UPI0012F3E078|nr:hypothetical protein [Novosphingobium sp. 9U]VWX52769.1 conserved hypothetical protein [Novosphingobium sp. 9U]